VEVGMLWMNMPAMPSAEMPFGGIKESGYGSEGGPEAMDAYLNARSVTIMNVCAINKATSSSLKSSAFG
jgi:succinate-semialdehyde dehydrogenase/glutarate-semialdehyde dehydrogenase